MPRTVHLLALVAAFSSAGATIFIRQGLRGSSPFAGFWINLAVGTVGLWTAVLATGGIGRVTATGFALFALAGLVGTVGGRLLRFVSIEKVGPSIAAALTNLNPLISSGLAILLLGERVTFAIVAGTVVIVAGTIVLSGGGRQIGVRPAQLAIPLLSALCFGVVAILRKVGLNQMGAVTGSAVNVSTALVAFTAFLLASGQRAAMTCRGRSLAHFIAAGVAENAGVFLNVVALGLGTVSVVAPLYGSAPIFVLLLSFFFLRGVEILSGRVVLGTLLIVSGVYLITAL
ncbi:MAG TPA: DMT family transporter [Candidatus Methylomirabilis sp.]|nr:DMT family transporter [Candidatus Methylomirabilis sp.]